MTTSPIEHQVATAFARDVADHRMIVKLDHGLYRHLVFEQRERAWNDRCELITAPGSLTITGDRGAHTFRRLTDMFQFFRGGRSSYSYGINPGYWAEKLPDSGRSVKVYSEDALKALLDECLPEPVKAYRAERAQWNTDFYKGLKKYGDQPEPPEEIAEICVQQYDNAVKSGLHVVRSGPAAWDVPLPTIAPKAPAPRKAKAEKGTPIRVTVTMAAAGGVL